MGKKLIIIGAGLSGISTGCYAQMNGYNSEIFEMHSVAGGLVATWRRKGYLVDGGIHFLLGHKPGTQINDIYRELGLTGTERYPEMTTYIRFEDEASGFSINISQDLQATSHALIDRFPEDRNLIDELFGGASSMRMSGGLYEMGLEQAPELMGLGDKARMFWKARKMFRYMRGRYARPISEVANEAKDPLLQRLLLNLFTPTAPAWLVMSMLAMVEDGQVGLISDSCTGFMEPMIKKYQDLGGAIHFRSKVKEIMTDEGKVTGVRLEDGSEHQADIVVSAADGRSTIYGMLDGRFTDERIDQRYRTWDPGASIVTVSLGLDMTFPDEPALKEVVLKEPLTSYGRPIDLVTFRFLSYGKVFAPPGKTLVQVIFDGDWNFWNDLRKDKERYEERKRLAAQEMLNILERHHPSVTSKVEMVDVSTPYTYWRYTGNEHGSIMGWAPPTDQILKTFPRTLPGLDGFYMAGQWSMPGGSVPTCIASGRQIVQLICHREGRGFRSSIKDSTKTHDKT